MRKIKDHIIRKIATDYILIDPNCETLDMTKVYTMNETSAYIWENLSRTEDFTVSDIKKLLSKEYDIDETSVDTDIKNLLTFWKDSGLITE